VLVLVVVEGYLALTSTRNQGTGFRLPLIPAVIILALFALHRLPWRRWQIGLVAAFCVVAATNLLMKANIVQAVSETRTVKLPGIRTLPWLNGESYVQGYLATEAATSPEGTTARLPSPLRGWLPAYAKVAAAVHRAPIGEAQPVLALGTFEPLVNPPNFTLAARLRFHDTLDAVTVTPAPGTPVRRIRDLLAANGANFLLTVDPPLPGFLGTPPPEAQIISAARRDALTRLRRFRLPDGRPAELWGRSNR
jgi:hypothetical protein